MVPPPARRVVAGPAGGGPVAPPRLPPPPRNKVPPVAPPPLGAPPPRSLGRKAPREPPPLPAVNRSVFIGCIPPRVSDEFLVSLLRCCRADRARPGEEVASDAATNDRSQTAVKESGNNGTSNVPNHHSNGTSKIITGTESNDTTQDTVGLGNDSRSNRALEPIWRRPRRWETSLPDRGGANEHNLGPRLPKSYPAEFGFATFPSIEGARRCAEMMNGLELNGEFEQPGPDRKGRGIIVRVVVDGVGASELANVNREVGEPGEAKPGEAELLDLVSARLVEVGPVLARDQKERQRRLLEEEEAAKAKAMAEKRATEEKVLAEKIALAEKETLMDVENAINSTNDGEKAASGNVISSQPSVGGKARTDSDGEQVAAQRVSGSKPRIAWDSLVANESALLSRLVGPWVDAQLRELMGEAEPSIVEFVKATLVEHKDEAATPLAAELEMVLDDDTPEFVNGLFKMLAERARQQ